MTFSNQRSSRAPKSVWWQSLFIFLIALLPRVMGTLISRPNLWFERAYRFGNAILAQEWAATYQRYHPGVTVMWLSGAGTQLYMRAEGFLTEAQITLGVPVEPDVITMASQYAQFPLGAAIAICIVAVYLLLRQLVRDEIALLAALLMALDPFLLANSKVLHVDAMLSSLMIVSALSLLVYLKTASIKFLMLSGAVGGLALLTKTTSIFLVAYAALALGVRWYVQTAPAWHYRSLKDWGTAIKGIGLPLLLWAVCAVVMWPLLFPALWTNAEFILQDIWSNLVRHAGQPHKNPVFFMGEAHLTDPGLPFYFAIIAFKLTAITFPIIVGTALWSLWRRHLQAFPLLWAMMAYATFFYLQMSLGQFKQIAYILPVAPALSIVAAVGLWHSADWIRGRTGNVKLSHGVLIAAITVQAIIALSVAPRYGTHHNRLLGGSRTAVNVIPFQEQSEGMELIAEYLNDLVGTDGAVIVHPRDGLVMRRTFEGQTSFGWDEGDGAYRVYVRNALQRGLYRDAWEEAYREDSQREPLLTVEFDGVIYVWLYGPSEVR